MPEDPAAEAPDSGVRSRFLDAMQRSFAAFLSAGPRSTEKLAPLHGWVQNELRRHLRHSERYTLIGQTAETHSERTIEGRYYPKRVDVSVEGEGRTLAVINIKFVLASYRKNAINYLEQQIGETANLRRQNIVYGNMFFLTNPIPAGKKEERLTARDIDRYLKLRRDHEHVHSPDEMAIGLVETDPERQSVLRLSNRSDLPLTEQAWKALDEEFSVENFFRKMALRIELKALTP